MKTTHQVARELLNLPDVPLVIEGWTLGTTQDEIFAKLTDISRDLAILVQRPKDFYAPKPQ